MSEKQTDPEHIEIVDYENLIEENDVQNIDRFFYELDQFKLNILKTTVEALNLYSDQAIGEPIVLNMLYDIKARVQKYIALKEVEIPEIADVKFILSGNLKDGRKILISKEFDSTSKIQTDRKLSVEYYERKLKDQLSLSLGELIIDLEKTISQIKNIGSFDNIEDFYPQLKNIDEKPDPRLKYNSENYFDTAFKIYRESKKENKKGLTWPEVYEMIVKEENELSLENKYSTYDSFDTMRKRYQREQSSSK